MFKQVLLCNHIDMNISTVTSHNWNGMISVYIMVSLYKAFSLRHIVRNPRLILSTTCHVISRRWNQPWVSDDVWDSTSNVCFKDFPPSDKFDNPYLIIPWVTNDNSEHLCALVSGTCFRVLSTLLYLHEHCPYITY